jgi:esterase/lipase superfamily enzyme
MVKATLFFAMRIRYILRMPPVARLLASATFPVLVLFSSCGEAPGPASAAKDPGAGADTPEPATTAPAPPKPESPAGTSSPGQTTVPAPAPPPSRYRPRSIGTPSAGSTEARSVADAPSPEAKSSKEYHTVEVFYGTNRKPTGFREANEFYGTERHREGPMQYGKIHVSIPLHHTVGVVERPKWYKLEFSEDPKKHVMLLDLETLGKDAFFEAVDTKTAESPEHEALLFIHGFNVSFPSAIQRTAQIAFDLDFHGTALAFSWPSQAALEAYTVDQDNAIWSVPHLSRFLVDLQEKTDIDAIHVIAHSMGTRVLTQALAQARDEGFDLKLNNVILAAPDIDADVFREQILPKISGVADRLTMYASSSDTALKLSQTIHGNDRLGLGGTFLKTIEGMDTVNATDIDTSLLGHAYYGSHRLVVRDLLNLVVRHLDPPRRDLVKGPLGEWDFKAGALEEADKVSDTADAAEEAPTADSPVKPNDQ